MRDLYRNEQIAGRSTIKAQIKLRFRNRAGKPVTCVRSMQVFTLLLLLFGLSMPTLLYRAQLTQRKVKLQFKALDSVLQTVDSNGEKRSLSNKCSEVDKAVPELLGVSQVRLCKLMLRFFACYIFQIFASLCLSLQSCPCMMSLICLGHSWSRYFLPSRRIELAIWRAFLTLYI